MNVNGALLAKLAEATAAYDKHPNLGFACCSAHAVADQVPALLADNARLRARIAELETERHTTNEALSDAAEQLHNNRDQIAHLETTLAEAEREVSR